MNFYPFPIQKALLPKHIKQILCQIGIYAGIHSISRKFKGKEDGRPLSREEFSPFLGNNLELLGKVLPLLGFTKEQVELKKVYMNYHDCSYNCSS